MLLSPELLCFVCSALASAGNDSQNCRRTLINQICHSGDIMQDMPRCCLSPSAFPVVLCCSLVTALRFSQQQWDVPWQMEPSVTGKAMGSMLPIPAVGWVFTVVRTPGLFHWCFWCKLHVLHFTAILQPCFSFQCSLWVMIVVEVPAVGQGMGRVECVCGAGYACEAGQGDSLQQAVGMGSDRVCGVLHFNCAVGELGESRGTFQNS